MPATPIARSTRVVLTLDLIFSLVAGSTLFFLATRTEDYFAWTIGIPLTAAVLGSGYLGAVAILIPSFWQRSWPAVRILAVIGFVLTFATLVVTLRHLDEFHLGSGSGTARVAGWAWLAVYVAVPILLAWVFVSQERAGGRAEYEVGEPPLPLTRVVLGGAALTLGAVGLGLVLAPGTFDGLWPWPLPPLSAGAVGAWLLTAAAAAAWGLRERDWGRFRIMLPGFATIALLVVVSALRFPEPLSRGDGEERVFLIVGAALVAATVWAARQQGRQSRRSRIPSG